MTKKKKTADSQILTKGEAVRLVAKYMAKSTMIKYRTFRKFLADKLNDLVEEKHYYNEAGLKAMGVLLAKKEEVEIKIDSNSDGRKKYYCVKFTDGTMACSCINFMTYQNVLTPRGKCKHILACLEEGVF